MKPGYWPDLPKMQQTIKDAGYKPVEDGIELRVSGKVGKEGDQLTLELDGMKSPVILRVIPAKDHPEVAALMEQKYVGQLVEVEGRWQPSADGKGQGSLGVATLGGSEGSSNKTPSL